jgi:hypothetical protein
VNNPRNWGGALILLGMQIGVTLLAGIAVGLILLALFWK